MIFVHVDGDTDASIMAYEGAMTIKVTENGVLPEPTDPDLVVIPDPDPQPAAPDPQPDPTPAPQPAKPATAGLTGMLPGN